MLRRAIALSALLFTTAASAQVSGSVALVSDYRFRGVSLSDERPAAQLALAYDQRDGWYAGMLASTVRPSGTLRTQLLTYLGLARPLGAGLDWEAGVDYASIVGEGRYDYSEAYVGLSTEHYSGRLYYTPHDFGQPSPALYATIDRHWQLTDRLRLLGHLGLLRRNGHADDESSHYRADARAGLGMTWRDYHLQLFWTIVHGSDAPYPFGYRPGSQPARQVWGVSLSRSW
ncbi:TorF family putative porin [Rhodanobacter ginsengisoli]|uniref:TorF family putative porin n=1 Tax=Rhodanobacter ginsengisoli TaxID=418646 RepID=A0ABW0QIQ5_9GAMM